MKISQTKTVPVQAKTLKIQIKIRDEFSADIADETGVILGGQSDVYVPDFMPGDHFGDYLILDIDLDTGQIMNWCVPDAEQIEEFLKGDE